MKTRMLKTFLVVGALCAVLRAQINEEPGVQAYRNRDYATAFKELLPLAQQGNAVSQFYLGAMYQVGRGVPQDYKEAAKWYRLAAEQRYAYAPYYLGLLYENGQGVPQDYVQAYLWFNLAGANDYALSAKYRVASMMTADQIAEAQRLARNALAPPTQTTAPATPQPIQAQSSSGPRQPAAVPEMSAEEVFQRFAGRVLFLTCDESTDEHSFASGVLASADGLILTNAHVVADCRSMTATRISGAARQSYGAVLKFYDEKSDTAVLKISYQGPDFFSFTSRPARVGERVYAIGNPRGFEQSISEGIVSGNREEDGVASIQHSAAISPGSSGGALISSHGELLGINSRFRKDSQNLNFAVPSNTLAMALLSARSLTGLIEFPANAGAEAMRKIANKIKQCQEVVIKEEKWGRGPLDIVRTMNGPPEDVVWGIKPSQNGRAPLTGYIEFSIKRFLWAPDKTRDKLASTNLYYYNGLNGIDFFPSEYRYEYDIVPQGIEFARAIRVGRPGRTLDSVAEPKDVCFDNLGRNPMP
jgi:S1-C subfamily serine protease